MEFKVGQKYRIVDVGKMWDRVKYSEVGDDLKYDEETCFSDMEIVTVVNCPFEKGMCLFSEGYSQSLKALMNSAFNGYHPVEEYLELIPDDEQQTDNTISLYHIADVLEDALNEYDIIEDNLEVLFTKIQGCIKSLRKAGY